MGRHILVHFNTICAACCCTSYLLPPYFFLEELKNKSQLKDKDKEVQVPKRILHLVNEVFIDMKYRGKKLLKPYLSKFITFSHAGYPNFNCNSIVAIPHYFTGEEMTSISIPTMVSSVKAGPELMETDNFKNTFRLSEEAKKFAIAREIYEANSNTFIIIGIIPLIVAAIINIFLLSGGKRMANMKNKRLLLPLYKIQVVSSGVFIGYILTRVLQAYDQIQADFSAAILGKKYAEGGVEYFEKMIERNRLINKHFSNTPFQVDGDKLNNYSFLLRDRARMVKKVAKTLAKNETIPSLWNCLFSFENLKFFE